MTLTLVHNRASEAFARHCLRIAGVIALVPDSREIQRNFLYTVSSEINESFGF